MKQMQKATLALIGIVITAMLWTACGGGSSPEMMSSANGSDATLDSLNQAIKDEPDNYKHYISRSKYLSSKSRFADAIRDLDRALGLDSMQAEIYVEKGEVYWMQKDVKSAYAQYKKSVEKNNQYVPGLIKTASIEIVLNNYDQALKYLDDALKVEVTNPEVYYFKGRLFKTKGDTATAISSYQTAVELNPQFYDAYVELALLVANQKNDLADEYYKTAIGVRPRSVEVWYNRAMFLQENGYREAEYYTRALACYDTIVQIDKNFSAAYYNKGYIFCTYLNEYTKAIEQFTKAIEHYPSYFQAFYSRGVCYEKMNNRKLALADYEQALKIKPDYDDAAIGKGRILGR
jgi:tetratricopeptide (TPR) repeat protein